MTVQGYESRLYTNPENFEQCFDQLDTVDNPIGPEGQFIVHSDMPHALGCSPGHDPLIS